MDKTVDASPTKDFFIDMLTRDIDLEHAIIDLVDNSIDGALTLRPSEQFDDLWIKIFVSESEFRIDDNCGGFSLETAQKYAFKFGRPSARPDVEHSVGRFGVGMKRALFKMGNHFIVESKHIDDHFNVEVDVKQWSSNDQSNWSFEYKEGGHLTTENGTSILVKNLHPSISSQFKIGSYINFLKKEIEKKHEFNLIKGIKMYLNTQQLGSNPVMISLSNDLKPISKQLKYGLVNVRIFAGITNAEIGLAGWYIYCNDRLLVEADQTKLTGWGEEKSDDEAKTRKFHHSFAMFRGVVLFDSKDPKQLPMKTTKDGIDANSDIYRAVKLEMKHMMRQVLNYLSKIESDDEREILVADAEKKTVLEIKQETLSEVFSGPSIKSLSASNNLVNISYKKDRHKVEKVKTALNVSSIKEIGEKTFDYYFNNEIGQ